ncbi:glycosyltransferase family 2 protein [Candidatus Beckwithbacteria bacterium]|nr:glycosyltransferase family 2 protein [Candidatus Beckwithbacteria bacterium]
MNKTSREQPSLAIIIPVYNEDKLLNETINSLHNLLYQLIKGDVIKKNSFLYFVDDGSVDNSWELIIKAHKKNSNIKGLKLSRNFGHQNALLAGLLNCKEKADCFITIDADLQQDIKTIPKFIDKYKQGADIVYGVRQNRSSDSFLKKYTALFFYHFMHSMGTRVIKNHADYRLISQKALLALAEFREVNLFLRGLVTELGFRIATVSFVVRPRKTGQTKYSWNKMLSFSWNGITSFSTTPLRLVTIIGFLVFLSSLAMTTYIVYQTLIIGKTVTGWPSIVLPIYVLGGLQIMSIGLIGEYLAKVYQEVKARPRFIIETEIF